MRTHSVPCCGESGPARKPDHRTRPASLPRPGQRRPIHPAGPRRMAHLRRRADPLRHRWPRPPPATRRQDRGNPRRRHRLHPGRRMALAPRHTRPFHDPPVHHRSRPGGQRPRPTGASTSSTRSTTSADAAWRPFPASRSTPLPGMTGTRRQADPPDLRPVGSMPSRHTGSTERRLGVRSAGPISVT